MAAMVKAGLLPLTGVMEGTSLPGMMPSGVGCRRRLEDAELVHVGVAEEGEADDVGEVGEGVGEGVGAEEHLGGLAAQTWRCLVKVE